MIHVNPFVWALIRNRQAQVKCKGKVMVLHDIMNTEEAEPEPVHKRRRRRRKALAICSGSPKKEVSSGGSTPLLSTVSTSDSSKEAIRLNVPLLQRIQMALVRSDTNLAPRPENDAAKSNSDLTGKDVAEGNNSVKCQVSKLNVSDCATKNISVETDSLQVCKKQNDAAKERVSVEMCKNNDRFGEKIFTEDACCDISSEKWHASTPNSSTPELCTGGLLNSISDVVDSTGKTQIKTEDEGSKSCSLTALENVPAVIINDDTLTDCKRTGHVLSSEDDLQFDLPFDNDEPAGVAEHKAHDKGRRRRQAQFFQVSSIQQRVKSPDDDQTPKSQDKGMDVGEVDDLCQFEDFDIEDVLPVVSKRSKRQKNRRRSADIDVMNTIVTFSPEEGCPSLPKPKVNARRSDRLRRKSLHLYRNSFGNLSSEPDVDEQGTAIDPSPGGDEKSPTSQGEGTGETPQRLIGLQETPSGSTPPGVVEMCSSTPPTPVTVSVGKTHGTSAGSETQDILSTEVEPSPRRSKRTQRSGSASPKRKADTSLASVTVATKVKHSTKRKDVPSVEDIYLNKLWRTQMPKQTSWETVFEVPRQCRTGQEYTSQKKIKRHINFEEFFTTVRLKRRRRKALQRGWKPLTEKREKALGQVLEKRLSELDKLMAVSELDKLMAVSDPVEDLLQFGPVSEVPEDNSRELSTSDCGVVQGLEMEIGETAASITQNILAEELRTKFTDLVLESNTPENTASGSHVGGSEHTLFVDERDTEDEADVFSILWSETWTGGDLASNIQRECAEPKPNISKRPFKRISTPCLHSKCLSATGTPVPEDLSETFPRPRCRGNFLRSMKTSNDDPLLPGLHLKSLVTNTSVSRLRNICAQDMSKIDDNRTASVNSCTTGNNDFTDLQSGSARLGGRTPEPVCHGNDTTLSGGPVSKRRSKRILDKVRK